MAVIKCKMCGGDLEIQPGVTVAECEYCGTKQTLPKANDEVVQNLFNRANSLRLKCEFDKAEQIYEKILQENESESEAHWGIVLCKYGIEYVEDPKTLNRIPTCHRTSYDAVVTDADYLAAVRHADVAQRVVYEAEARQIDEIQKNILEIVKNEKPFDVFLCYKQSDENGKRTPDSAIANDIYYQLTQEGLKVFYAAITLEDKLGQAYEPYIFAALNSAKVMLVIGSKPHYFNAVWVKNEWSRFLKLMKTDRSKLLIPCYKDMDAYELPEEFAHLQAQDMTKIGFINDVVRGIKKVTVKDEPKATVIKETVVSGNTNTAPLLKRAFMFLEDGEFDRADEFCEQVLNLDPECAMAYVGKLMAELKVKKESNLKHQAQPFDNNANYQKAIRFADAKLKTTLTGYIDFIVNRNLETAYQRATTAKHIAESENDFKAAAEQFNRIKTYKDSAELANKCRALAEEARLKAIAEAEAAKQKAELERLERDYQAAIKEMQLAKDAKFFRYAATLFKKLGDYKDSAELFQKCTQTAEDMQKDDIILRAMVSIKQDTIAELESATEILQGVAGWKNADALISQCEDRITQLKVTADKLKKRKITGVVVTLIAIALVVAFAVLLFVEIIPGGKYKDAVAMMESGKYEEAVVAFQELGDYKDSKDKIDQCEYRQAEIFQQNGEIVKAAIAFGKAGDYLDAKTRSFALWEQAAVRDTISAGGNHTVGLKADGTVVAVGDNYYGQCDVTGWTDIIAINAGDDHTVGLKSDGTVVAVGYNYYGQCYVTGWTDIVAISAGYWHTVGLKSDGTVVAVGYNYYGQCDVTGWTDIVAISAGKNHTVGLKADGTVVAVGDNYSDQCDVTGWTDIVAISAGNDHTVGLKADGTVVAVGWNYFGQCDVTGWTDIIAISAGSSHTVGLKADGTVVAVGYNYDGQCDVTGWTDIIAISAGDDHTVGLKADGTVVAVGCNDEGQCNVTGWTGIKVPKK